MTARELLSRKVLDLGYLRTIEFYGSDESIIEAARMSTRKGFLGWDPGKCPLCLGTGVEVDDDEQSTGVKCLACGGKGSHPGDAKLLRFLYTKKHMTPFEMAGAIIEVKAPIMVFREWHRHRTQCLAGDTEIYFEVPHRFKKAQRASYKLKIKDLYDRWQPSMRKDRPERQTNAFFKRHRVQNMLLRCLNEDSKTFIHTNITDVIYSGKKPTYEVILEDGKKISCSADHRFLFKDGWAPLKDGAGLTHQNKVVAWSEGTQMYVNGVFAYRDADWLKTRYHAGKTLGDIALEAGVSTHAIRKWLKKCNLQTKNNFVKGHVPWNVGKTYKTGAVMPEEHKDKIREARSGSKSNFWKGGVSSDRVNVARWTREQAPKVHEKFKYICQLCKAGGRRLHAHHVIPVWADVAKAYDFENLASLCEDCHHQVHGRELDYVSRFTGLPLPAEYVGKTPRTTKGQPKLIAKLVRIKEIRYIGEQDCYDLSVEGPFHNFVANGIVTHNSYNEMSGRYIALPNENYTPTVERLMINAGTTNKQAGTIAGAEVLTLDRALEWLTQLADVYEHCERVYQQGLQWGVPKELARLPVPVARYSAMRANANLRNWLGFLTLRAAPDAQWEIREYANVLAEILTNAFPRTLALWDEGRKAA